MRSLARIVTVDSLTYMNRIGSRALCVHFSRLYIDCVFRVPNAMTTQISCHSSYVECRVWALTMKTIDEIVIFRLFLVPTERVMSDISNKRSITCCDSEQMSRGILSHLRFDINVHQKTHFENDKFTVLYIWWVNFSAGLVQRKLRSKYRSIVETRVYPIVNCVEQSINQKNKAKWVAAVFS